MVVTEDIIQPERTAKLDQALRRIEQPHIGEAASIMQLADKLNQVKISNTVLKAVAGPVTIPPTEQEGLEDPLRGPLMMRFDQAGDEFLVAVFMHEGHIALSSNTNDPIPDETADIARQLNARGVQPDDIVQQINKQVEVRTKNIEQASLPIDDES